MIIERKTVIKALKTEPLARGYFFEVAAENIKDCKVCAVGGIVRQHLSDAILQAKRCDELSQYCEYVTGYKYDISVDESQQKELIKEGNYLGALSAFFERQSDSGKVTKKHRESLVNFVKKNFPVKFKIKTPKQVNKLLLIRD